MSNPTVTVHDHEGLDALPPHTIITEVHDAKGHDAQWTYETMDPRDNCGMKLRRIHTDYDQTQRLGPIGSPLGQGYVVFPVVVENPEILDFDFETPPVSVGAESHEFFEENADWLTEEWVALHYNLDSTVPGLHAHLLPEGTVLVVEGGELVLVYKGK